MATFEKLTNNLRDTVDHLAEGWQDLWQKARNAITRYTPGDETDHTVHGSRWGVLSAELRELDDTIEVLLEAPGMNPADFDLRIENQTLTVRGSKHYHSETKKGRYYLTERAYGSFERVLPLPCDVEEKTATANYRKGVLEVTLKKHATAKPRKIEVVS